MSQQIWQITDGNWFTLEKEVQTEAGVTLPAGTKLYVCLRSTTEWFTVSDGKDAHRISKYTVGIKA